MRALLQSALDLGWTLIPYDAEPGKWIQDQHGIDLTQADPEEQQALNMVRALRSLPENTRLLVWCGNSHHAKTPREGWTPMGYQFQRYSQIQPFVIDQCISVKFDPRNHFVEEEWILPFAKDLARYGGTAGFLAEEIPEPFVRLGVGDLGVDAVLLSTQNELG